MRDCRFAVKGVCYIVPDEEHACPYDVQERYKCMDYQGRNETK